MRRSQPIDTVDPTTLRQPRARRQRRKASDVGDLLLMASMSTEKEARRIYRDIREDEWSEWVRHAAETRQWIVFLTRRSERSPAGEPDFRMISPPLGEDGTRRYWAVELKTERGLLSDAQRDALSLLDECVGVEWGVFRPSKWREIIDVLDQSPYTTTDDFTIAEGL